MKKTLFLVITLLVIFIIACKQIVKKEVPKVEVPKVETTQAGDATTDSFGNDMGSVNNDDKELSSSELEGIDSGFNEVENI